MEIATQPLPSPIPQTSQAVTPTKLGLMKKSNGLIFVIILILLVLVGGGSFYLGTVNPLLFHPKTGKQKISFTDDLLQLPVNLNNPYLVRAGILFGFYGRITDVQKKGNDLEILTDVKEDGQTLPFIITDKTIVHIYDTPNFRAGNLNDLLKGRVMTILAEYRVKEDRWITNYVILDAPKDSTPAAGLRSK